MRGRGVDVYFLELSNGDIYVGSTGRTWLRDETTAQSLERYFKSGSGKAFAKHRFLRPEAWSTVAVSLVHQKYLPVNLRSYVAVRDDLTA